MVHMIRNTIYEKISSFKTVHEAYKELTTLFGTQLQVFFSDT